MEDRLATLKNVIKEPGLDGWNLYLGIIQVFEFLVMKFGLLSMDDKNIIYLTVFNSFFTNSDIAESDIKFIIQVDMYKPSNVFYPNSVLF